jgi:hypothetical protein
MSNTFNFGSLANIQVASTSQPRLKPWGIYPVTFAGARKETIQGKKDSTMTYDILKVRFEGESGYYEESIFFPKDGDDVRPKYTNADGHEYEAPSSLERTMTFIAHVAGTLNPEGFKKMQEMSKRFKSFDDVVKAFITLTDSCKGKQTNLKLIGKVQDGNVVPALPKYANLNKNGELWTSNFLGDKLSFSNYEESKKNEYNSATPTAMKPTMEEPEDDGDVDFDSLLS